MKNNNKAISFFMNTFCIIFGILVFPFVLLFYAILSFFLFVVSIFGSLIFMSIDIGFSVFRKEMPVGIELFYYRMSKKIDNFFNSIDSRNIKDIDDEEDYFDGHCDCR